MQITPLLGNCRERVIRSFRPTKQESRAVRAAPMQSGAGSSLWTYFSEATGPFEAAGSGSKPNTPTRYL
jgi:hypothetical protein